MKGATLAAVLVTAGCGGVGGWREPPPAPPMDLAAEAPNEDMAFRDPAACPTTVDAFCATASCFVDLVDVQAQRSQCQAQREEIELHTCGDRTYVNAIRVPEDRYIYVYDAHGTLVAVFDMNSGTPVCVAGPARFVDPDLLSCPTDGGDDVVCPSLGCPRGIAKCA